MLLGFWIGLHVHLSTWLAACGDADKSHPLSLVSFSPAYTLLFPHSQTHVHTYTFRVKIPIAIPIIVVKNHACAQLPTQLLVYTPCGGWKKMAAGMTQGRYVYFV